MANADRIIDLLHEARARPAGAEREQFLAGACGEDAALKEQIQSLLEADATEGETDMQRISQVLRPRIRPSEKAGDRIGRYKLLEQIGEGGCGVVYVAEQEEPVRRRVALKVIKLGMDTKQVVARFEAERQALAMMDHPNIARVLDAGATDNGRPYFVMELVRGIRITDYCDQNHLATRERLDLFIKVCQAIQHAHQKGIIHRDIKPSNILVTVNDGVPLPKVIDFGIAKATLGRLTDQTVYTAFEQFIGTPAYMSPEQAEMTSLDIDTRSDIYSLGVLLYELLAGSPPFDPKELVSQGIDAMRRIIREQEPARPSTKLATLTAEELTTTARRRSADAPKLIRQLDGDLDWIVMKCLEKDRTRRYETANGLASDLQRHLSNQPVTARPPSRLYEFQKTFRRHKFGFAAAGVVALALVLGIMGTAWQAVRASRAQQREHLARTAADDARLLEAGERKLAQKNARLATESQHETQRLLYAADMKLAQTAWEEGNLSQMIQLLDAHRPKPGEDDPRGFEYFYFQELAKGEQEHVFTGHTNAVVALAVSPDGKYLATRSESDTRLWDLAGQMLVGVWPSKSLPPDDAYTCGISFSYDSRYLAFPGKDGLNFCDLRSRQVRLVRAGAVDKPLFAPDSPRMVLGARAPGSRTVLWNYETDQSVEVLKPGWVGWVWSQDVRRLLSGYGAGGFGSVEVWDTTTFQPMATNTFGQFIFGAAFSPDGRQLAAEEWQGEVCILDPMSGRILGKMDAGDIRSTALAFSPDGKFLATGSPDQAILIWNVESRQRVRQLRGHRSKLITLAYTPDGRRLVSGDWAGDVLIWDLDRETRGIEIPNRFQGFDYKGLEFSGDGRYLAVESADNECNVFDTSSWLKVGTVAGQLVAFSPDSQELAYTTQRHREPLLCVGPIGASAPRATLHLDLGRATDFPSEVSPLGDFLSQMSVRNPWDCVISVFDCTARTELIAEHSDALATFPTRFLPDKHTCVCATSSRLNFWDLRSRKKTRVLDCRSPVQCIAVSPDGRYLAASRKDYKIALWDLDSDTEVATLA